MAVAFNNMPGTIRVPLFYAEINAGVAPFAGGSRQVLIGHKLSGGSATVGALVNLGGSNPNVLFGQGSMLAEQALFARRMDPTGEIYCLPIAEPSGGAAAAGAIAITGAATAAGVLTRFIGGERVSVAVASGDSAATVAARLNAAINAGYTKFNRAMKFAVSSTVSTGTLTLTARHAGELGNAIRIESDLEGPEPDAPGLTVTVTAMADGAGTVDLAAALALLGSAPADWISGPFATTTQLNAVRDFLSDAGSGRNAPTVQLGGFYTTAISGNLSTVTSFGQGRNDRHVSIEAANNAPNTPWARAAALNGAIARSKNLGVSISEAVEISRPLQTIILEGIKPPKSLIDRWGQADLESLFQSGLAGCTVDASGQVRISRVCTTYQKNAFDQPDATFLDVETYAQGEYIRRYLRHAVEANFPRHVLKDENPRNLQGVATPVSIGNVVDHAYKELCDWGIAENFDLFVKSRIVERSSDANRVNVFIPADVANQLKVFAANITITTQAA